MPKGGALVIQSLLANGIPLLFGVPGEPMRPVLDALREAAGRVRFVACRRAAAAAHMADAAGKLTGRASVCIVSQAAGALDAAIGVHAALQACTPMIVLICTDPRGSRRGDAPREVDYQALYRPLTKWIAEVDDPERLTEYLSRAFHGAHAGRPGPVALVLPADILTADAATRLPKPLKPAVAGASDAMVAAAAALLARSVRPLFVVGSAGWTPGAARDLARFAEASHVPVATAQGCPDGYDNRLRTYAGRLGAGTDPGSAPCIDDADLLVVVGHRLTPATAAAAMLAEPPYAAQRIIHVFPDPDEIGRAFMPDLGIVASPAAFLASLATKPLAASADRQEWVSRARAVYEAGHRPPADDGPLDIAELVRRLDAQLPDNAVICTGTGPIAAGLLRHFSYRAPRTALAPLNGAADYGIPAAVAAKLITAGAAVVALVEEDCESSLTELATAARHRLPIVVIVAVSHGSGEDFLRLAACHGARGFVVADGESFDAALQRALSADQPVVIPVVIGPEGDGIRHT